MGSGRHQVDDIDHVVKNTLPNMAKLGVAAACVATVSNEVAHDATAKLAWCRDAGAPYHAYLNRGFGHRNIGVQEANREDTRLLERPRLKERRRNRNWESEGGIDQAGACLVDAANQAECVEKEQARSRKGRSTEKIGILRRVKICHQFTGHEKRKSRKKAAAPYSAEAEASLLKIMMVPLLTRA